MVMNSPIIIKSFVRERLTSPPFSMYIHDHITEQLRVAETRKQAIEIILDECFQEDLQDSALDWCEQNRPDLFSTTLS